MFLVNDPKPIDYLEKMPDNERDLKSICEAAADDFLKNQKPTDPTAKNEARFEISSKAYCRKCNVTSDKAHNQCWEVHYRFDAFDLFITILRRAYIPSITMDMYQDIIIQSKIMLDTEEMVI